MAFRRFRRRFEHMSKAGKVTYPANWSGEVSDDVAKAADDAGATLVEKAKAAEKPASNEPKSLDEMTKEELLAEAETRKVEVKASENKADILAAIKAAEKPVS